MINDAPQPTLETQPENEPFNSVEQVKGNSPDLPYALSSPPAAPKRTSKKRWTIFSTALVVIACCILAVGFTVVTTLINFGQEKASIAKVLDSYMYAMKVKNPERAYGFFSPQATSQVPISRLQEWLEGKGYGMFEGYQSLMVDSFSLAFIIKREPNQPRGIVYIIKGTILYEGGIRGSVNATLEKVNGQWKIYDVTVKVPMDKLK